MSKQTVYLNRGDFVGNYLGQTEIKTQQILEAHLHNKIAIDLTHLILNEKDLYGRTARATINRFIDDHPEVEIDTY
jgi:hypothetical protein